MAFNNNTILITGGSSGLGLEMAKQFSATGNKVIICSRSAEKLQEAKKIIPTCITYVCDIANETERRKLCDWIKAEYAELNILINNAAIVHRTNFISDNNSYANVNHELATNLVAPIHLIHLLFPLVTSNANAKLINITTGLVYVPRADYPFYNATKAALHSFTQVLRFQTKHKAISIIEVLFPVVDTPWHEGNPPKIAIKPEEAVKEMMKGLVANKTEIKVGGVKLLYFLSRLAPAVAFRIINSLK